MRRHPSLRNSSNAAACRGEKKKHGEKKGHGGRETSTGGAVRGRAIGSGGG